MLQPLSEKEQMELEEILKDPVKRRRQALKAIEGRVPQETTKSGKSSTSSKRPS
jgi:hypothetical protein